MGGVLIVNVVLVYAGPSTSLYFSVSYLDWVGRNDQHRNLNINNIVGHIPVTFGECPNEYSFKGNFSKAKAISGQPWIMKLLLRVLSTGELLLVFNSSFSDWPRLKNGYKVFSASNWNLGWSSDGSQHSCLKMAESFEKENFAAEKFILRSDSHAPKNCIVCAKFLVKAHRVLKNCNDSPAAPIFPGQPAVTYDQPSAPLLLLDKIWKTPWQH